MFMKNYIYILIVSIFFINISSGKKLFAEGFDFKTKTYTNPNETKEPQKEPFRNIAEKPFLSLNMSSVGAQGGGFTQLYGLSLSFMYVKPMIFEIGVDRIGNVDLYYDRDMTASGMHYYTRYNYLKQQYESVEYLYTGDPNKLLLSPYVHIGTRMPILHTNNESGKSFSLSGLALIGYKQTLFYGVGLFFDTRIIAPVGKGGDLLLGLEGIACLSKSALACFDFKVLAGGEYVSNNGFSLGSKLQVGFVF